jgi:ADP-ribose pyrophosphatase YjhB (NUDIX family)
MKYCSSCSATITVKIPQDDSRERFVCETCSAIYYENPRNVVGTIPIWKDKVLLCKRAIQPRLGFWTLPAGFLEIGESTSDGAKRETLEEAGAHVRISSLFSLLNVTHVGQVHLFYLAIMDSPLFEAGVESLEVRLFSESEIPWDEISFPTVKKTLEWFFSDRKLGKLEDWNIVTTHLGDISSVERIDKKYHL